MAPHVTIRLELDQAPSSAKIYTRAGEEGPVVFVVLEAGDHRLSIALRRREQARELLAAFGHALRELEPTG